MVGTETGSDRETLAGDKGLEDIFVIKNLGVSPKELLASALAACTSATVKMYADRKGWGLEETKLEITLEWDEKENKTVINRKIDFVGNLDDDQKSRLLKVANTCPVHIFSGNQFKL